jgi:hypothetical protein
MITQRHEVTEKSKDLRMKGGEGILLSLHDGGVDGRGFRGRLYAELALKQVAATIVCLDCIRIFAEIPITDHELPVEFFGQMVRIQPLQVKFHGIFPFPFLLVKTAGFENDAEQPVLERFATGGSPRQTGVRGKKRPFMQADGFFAELYGLVGGGLRYLVEKMPQR